jgi:hypothetical protein
MFDWPLACLQLAFGDESVGRSSTGAEASTSEASDCHWHLSIPR